MKKIIIFFSNVNSVKLEKKDIKKEVINLKCVKFKLNFQWERAKRKSFFFNIQKRKPSKCVMYVVYI